MGKLLIGLDYDGTVVHHAFPEVGEFQEDAVRVLKRITDAGHKLILWTCREDETRRAYLTEAVNKLKDAGIPLRKVVRTTAKQMGNGRVTAPEVLLVRN